MRAEILPVGQAVLASTAEDRRVEGHTIPCGEVPHVPADGIDDPGRLVTHHERRDASAGRAGEAVHVTAADAARGDADANLVGARRGDVDVGHGEGAGRREQERFHERALEGRRREAASDRCRMQRTVSDRAASR